MIFRTNDVRGVYGKDFDDDTAERLGRAFGSFIGSGKKIIVSRDVRPTGEKIKERFIKGAVSVGCDVVDIGVATTPMMYFAVHRENFDGGASITASHNPSDWNGFKLVGKKASQFHTGGGLEKIKEKFVGEIPAVNSSFGKSLKKSIKSEYESFLLSKIKKHSPLKIVIDPGNGAACGIAEEVLRRMGHEVFVINGNPDGTFPSRPSDPSEKNVSDLKREVLSRGADIGMAFDGDADRLGLVDGLGRYVSSGNITIPIFARHYLSREKGAAVVYDVCCSSCVEESIKEEGGIPVVSKVGQPAIRKKMEEVGAVFGGEYSSHLNFSEIENFDDAIFAALKMVEIISDSGQKMSDLVDSVRKYPTSRLEEIYCEGLGFEKRDGIVKEVGKFLEKIGHDIIDIDGVKAHNSDGWVLIRASNTMPTIKINAEAKTTDAANRMLNDAVEAVKAEIRRRTE